MLKDYDTWKARDPREDYDNHPECQCCDAPVDVVEDGDEDGAYLIVPELCSLCEEHECSAERSPCECHCGERGTELGLCERHAAFLDAARETFLRSRPSVTKAAPVALGAQGAA